MDHGRYWRAEKENITYTDEAKEIQVVGFIRPYFKDHDEPFIFEHVDRTHSISMTNLKFNANMVSSLWGYIPGTVILLGQGDARAWGGVSDLSLFGPHLLINFPAL